MTAKPTSGKEHLAELRRAHVIGLAQRLGLTISAIPGGHWIRGRRVDLWVTDLQYVNDADLSFH